MGLTTYFFSKFLDNYLEIDLWKIFIKGGKVWEIFLAKRRDKWGNRYGIVGFNGVQNEKYMEKQRDGIRIGNI